MVPVRVGAGVGSEDRIMENRRLKLKSGKEADVRHAYSLPPDDEVAAVGPVDPQIGILRLDRLDGRTLAVVYNFACHPIQGVPSGGNTADIIGFASRVIEDNLSEGTIALFLQGCGGDVNPVLYKDVDHPRDAEPLGNLLGLSTLQGVRKIKPGDDTRLTVLNETIALPRADVAQRIIALEAEQQRLVASLGGTSLNLKTFLPLAVKYNLAGEFPSYYSHRYLHEKARGREHLARLDAENRNNMRQYVQNIYTMEQLTRNQTNLALLAQTPGRQPGGRQAHDRRGTVGSAHRRLRAGHLSRRADRRDGTRHQTRLASPTDIRGGLHQRLHLLRPHRRATPQRGRSAGRQRLRARARVAEDL